MRSRVVLAGVLCVVSIAAVACRPKARDDVPGQTETRSGVLERGGEAPPAATTPAPAPVEPDRPAEAEVAVPTTPARLDGGAAPGAEARQPLPGADDSPRPRWLPTTDRLSVIRADDRDKNLGIADAGAP